MYYLAGAHDQRAWHSSPDMLVPASSFPLLTVEVGPALRSCLKCSGPAQAPPEFSAQSNAFFYFSFEGKCKKRGDGLKLENDPQEVSPLHAAVPFLAGGL